MRVSLALLIAGTLLSSSLIAADQMDQRTPNRELRVTYAGNDYIMDQHLTRSDCEEALRINRRYSRPSEEWRCSAH